MSDFLKYWGDGQPALISGIDTTGLKYWGDGKPNSVITPQLLHTYDLATVCAVVSDVSAPLVAITRPLALAAGAVQVFAPVRQHRPPAFIPMGFQASH